MSKRIEDLTAAETIELANTLLEIQQLNLTAGAQSRKLQLDDLRSIMFPAGFFGDFAGSSAPDGWLACDGSAVSRSTYADLFAAIGTTWGVGDGSTTFNVPDLRGAFVRGTGSHGSETMADGNAFSGPSVGAFEDDQMQGHRHGAEYRTDTGSPGSRSLTSPDGTAVDTGADNTIRDPITDGTNGTPRTGDETRPFAAGVTYCIKATPATNSGTPLPTYSYSTGWVANSDWTNAEFTVTHGLNAPLSDLVVKFFVSTDGTEANAFEVINNSFDVSTAANRARGVQINAASDNQFTIITGDQGLDSLVLNQNLPELIDTESYYYKVKVYRPEVLATELSVTKYDTGWVDVSGAIEGISPSIAHNLGADLESLIVQVMFEGDTGVFVGGFADSSDGGSNRYGYTLAPDTANAFTLLVGLDGILHINETGNGLTLLSDADSTAKYRVVVYAPNLLENVTPAAVKSVSADYTITGRTDSPTIQVTTGATDRTITLPAGTGMIPGDEIEVDKDDSGTGKVTLAAAGADTIDGVASVDIDSQDDYARVRWTGSRWRLVEYKDHGSNANGKWRRLADGTLIQRGSLSVDRDSLVEANIGTYGWSYYQTALGTDQDVSLPISFESSDYSISFSGNTTVASGRPDTVSSAKVFVTGPSSTTGISVTFIAEGRWRA